MRLLISFILAFALCAVSMLHFMWSMGSTFPASDEKILARTVAGFKGIDKMPPRPASFVVAVALLIFAILPVVVTFHLVANSLWQQALVCFIAVVFLTRGIIGFTTAWRRITPEQPFASLDKKLYSPLCLAFGLGYLILLTGMIF